jgi:hypothetical protein
MVRMSETNPVCLVHLVDLVCFVYLVHLVSFVQPNKRDKPKKPNNSLLFWRTFSASPYATNEHLVVVEGLPRNMWNLHR